MKIDWARKLTSRKFWFAIIGFVTSILIAFRVPNLEIEQIQGIIGALGVLVAYIFAESYVDSKLGATEVEEIEEDEEYEEE